MSDIKDRNLKVFIQGWVFLFITIFFIPIIALQIANRDRDQTMLQYESLCSKLKNCSPEELEKFDYTLFRKITFQSGKMHEELDDKLEAQYYTALKEKDYPGLLEVCKKILTEDYTHIKYHRMKAYAHIKLSQDDPAKCHLAIVNGLTKSILSTGDGKNFETAWHVFLVREEYDLLKELGFFEVTEQKLINFKGKPYDILEAKDKENNKGIFYFDVSDTPSMNINKK